MRRAKHALIVVLVVALMVFASLALPRMQPANNATAAGSHYVKLGMMQDVSFWNPLYMALASDYLVCYDVFSVLFQYDQDFGGPVNDLATGYYQVIHPGGNMTTFINITDHAYFRNLKNPYDTSHILTPADVEFTIELILANPGGIFDQYLTDIDGVNVTGAHQVAIDTAFSKSTLIDDLVWIPILPKFQWESVPTAEVLTNKDPAWLIGSGPFMFNSSVPGSWYKFDRAPNYCGSKDYPTTRVVKVDGLVYCIYTDMSAMVLDMNSGALDAVSVSGSPNLFTEQLGRGNLHITKMTTHENGMVEISINAVPMDFRTATYGKGNPLLLDPYVRMAIEMTLNRSRIANILLNGLATPGDSVLPSGPSGPFFWHKNITNALPFNTTEAMELLLAHGYSDTNGDGVLEATSSAYPVMQGWASAGDPLLFRLRVPDTDPVYDIIARDWVPWAAQAGIQLNYAGPTPESIMVSTDWYEADFDIWVWAWYWSPEPLSNLAVWKTSGMREGGSNVCTAMGPWWYSAKNSTTGDAYSAYDENYSLAQRTLNKVEKKKIVDDLQQMIYDSYAEIIPTYPVGLYAVSNQSFTGWGNWTQHFGRSFKSDLPWLWFDLEPTGTNVKKGASNLSVWVGIGIVAVAVILVFLFLLMRRKRLPGEEKQREQGGIEGAPPREPPKKV